MSSSSELESTVPRKAFVLFGDAGDGMPPWITRAILQVATVIVLLWASLTIGRRLHGFFVLLAISLFLAIALEPGVAYLARRGWKRGIATAVILGSVLLGGLLFVALMVPLVVDQLSSLIGQLPGYVATATAFARDRLGLDVSGQGLNSAVSTLGASVNKIAADVAGSIFGVGSKLIGTIFQLLTIGLFTFYLTAEAPKTRRVALSVLPPARQREALHIIEIAIEKTGGYFYSRALLAAVASLATGTALWLIGLPYPIPLGLWVGVMSQFVPVVGTYIGGVLPLLIALLEDPVQAIWVLIFILLYQQLENYVLSPRITAHTMSLHPAVAFGSAIIGGTLLGAPGALMALPVAATIQAFIGTYLHRHELVESTLLDQEVSPADGE